MTSYGYARVSSREDRQLLDRQLDALNSAGCEKIFQDRMSGARNDRPGLAKLLSTALEGDCIVVLDLDRLGRRAGALIHLIESLEARGVGFKALNSPMDTTTPAGRAFLQIQAAFAEMERNLARQRILEGLAAARDRGRFGGRPRHITPPLLQDIIELSAASASSPKRICERLNISWHGARRYIRESGVLTATGLELIQGPR